MLTLTVGPGMLKVMLSGIFATLAPKFFFDLAAAPLPPELELLMCAPADIPLILLDSPRVCMPGLALGITFGVQAARSIWFKTSIYLLT